MRDYEGGKRVRQRKNSDRRAGSRRRMLLAALKKKYPTADLSAQQALKIAPTF